MKKPNITEGEWLQYGAHVALSGYGKMIANCVSDIPDAECLANAKSISAVPDMIDALIQARKTMRSILDHGEQDIVNGYAKADLKIIETALSKAGVTEEQSTSLRDAAQDGIRLSKKIGNPVYFEFNSVTCACFPDGHPDNIVKNYHAALRSDKHYKRASSRRQS